MEVLKDGRPSVWGPRCEELSGRVWDGSAKAAGLLCNTEATSAESSPRGGELGQGASLSFRGTQFN